MYYLKITNSKDPKKRSWLKFCTLLTKTNMIIEALNIYNLLYYFRPYLSLYILRFYLCIFFFIFFAIVTSLSPGPMHPGKLNPLNLHVLHYIRQQPFSFHTSELFHISVAYDCFPERNGSASPIGVTSCLRWIGTYVMSVSSMKPILSLTFKLSIMCCPTSTTSTVDLTVLSSSTSWTWAAITGAF